MPNLKGEAKDEAREIADDIRGNIWARLRPKIVNGGAALVEKVGMKVLAPVMLIIMGGGGLAVAEQTTDFQPVSNFSSVVVSAATEGTDKDAEQFATLEGQMASSTAAMLDLTGAFHDFVLDITPRINWVALNNRYRDRRIRNHSRAWNHDCSYAWRLGSTCSRFWFNNGTNHRRPLVREGTNGRLHRWAGHLHGCTRERWQRDSG